jgi:hypothetical protein
MAKKIAAALAEVAEASQKCDVGSSNSAPTSVGKVAVHEVAEKIRS